MPPITFAPMPLQIVPGERHAARVPPPPPSKPFIDLTPPAYLTDATLAGQFSNFAAALPRVALSVTEISDPRKRPYFGVRDDIVDFSASTCKSTALFAASLLLSALRRHARSVALTVPHNRVLDGAAADFKQEILSIARAHASLSPASDDDLLPRYGDGFSVTAASGTATSHTVDFSAAMSGAIDEMVKISSNAHSKIVIDNTGFGYIHGALVHAGLFNVSSNTGLWLAGDYMQVRTARRIPAVNDGDTAQGATTRAFVSMLDMALRPTFPDAPFVAEKLALSRVKHYTWLTRPGREKKGFRDVRGKIGDNALKGSRGGHLVYSEIVELTQLTTARRFLVSYQNARESQLASISDFVLDGLTQYIQATTAQPAVPGGTTP